MNTLFGHISSRLGTQTENIATEALAYILGNSQNARRAFQKFVSRFESRISGELTVRTQVYQEDGSGIPDLICFNSAGQPVVVVEAKFWAGLTENQPVAYLGRLPKGIPSLLLFLAPEKRLPSLWSEVMLRCEKASLPLQVRSSKIDPFVGKINKFHSVGGVTWTALLNTIAMELEVSGDFIAKGDVIQLQGLCSQMDADAFLPIHSTELSPGIAQRNMQFADLVDDVVFTGAREGFCSTDGGKLKPTTGPNHYGRYFKLGDFFCTLKFDNERWSKFRNTPLWLEVYGKSWKPVEERLRVRRALASLELAIPSRLLVDDIFVDQLPVIPLVIPLGVVRDVVVESLLNELREIHRLLNENYPK